MQKQPKLIGAKIRAGGAVRFQIQFVFFDIEFGLATRYHLTHSPLKKVGVGPMALDMFSKDRMSLRPHRIKAMPQLRAILDKAKSQEAN